MNGCRRLTTIVVGVLAWLLATGVARAEWNPTPIAIPLTGTSGASSPYPSTIELAPPGGTRRNANVTVTLHGVTHPCPEDLTVLLVLDGMHKNLMMSNAGGCRPLQGTDIVIGFSGLTLPDTDPVTTPHGSTDADRLLRCRTRDPRRRSGEYITERLVRNGQRI